MKNQEQRTLKNGVTDWLNVEPITSSFEVTILPQNKAAQNSSKYTDLKDMNTIPQEQLVSALKVHFEVEKRSLSEAVLILHVSPTTVRRLCRTFKIGKFSDQIPPELKANSSQVPYGWNSINGILEKDLEQWGNVEWIFKERTQGSSLHKIAREMNFKRIKTKNKGRWFAKTISQVLKFNAKFLEKN